jgi:sporulation lipoprotein, YhcN/YlaJ family
MRNLLVIGLLMVAVAGCRPANEPPANEAAPPQAPNEDVRVRQTQPAAPKNQSAQATAERLVRLAVKVPGVQDATAVVAGKFAVVGIDVSATLDRSRVGTIKYTVAEALKEDPQGANAIVTADPDIVQRLREMAADIRRGRPIGGVAEELADIVGRIVPQPTREVERRERPADRESQERLNQTPEPKPPGR